MAEISREFFKVFLPTQSSQRLLIPPAFVRKHGCDLIARKLILLDSTAGKLWNVDVEVIGKNLFIHNGWHDFVTDNSLEYGDFLVFSYSSENSVFHVRLFGKNGCLKKMDSSLIIDDVKPISRKEDSSKLVQSSARFPRACKRKAAKVVRSQTNDGSLDRPRSKSRILDGMNDENNKEMPPAKPIVRPKTPHFIALMKKCSRYNMHIPVGPLKENEIKLAETLLLRDHNDKLWPLKVSVTSDGRSHLSTGWSNFRSHMKLESKDQCLLEFVLEKGNICKELKAQVFYADSSKQKILGMAV